MPLFRRPDGKLAQGIPATRRIMPYLMRGRNESLVYFEQRLDLGKTLPFLERWNAAHERRITVFHLLVHALVQMFAARPRVNRFVSGGRLYERDGIWVSFSAKKALNDDSPIIVIKRRFEPAGELEQTVARILGDVDEGRGPARSTVDKELGIILAVPGPMVRFLMWLARSLDAWNLFPGAMIRSDPMYASVFVANLGSVRLEAPYHHLYEWGNCPVFAAIGAVKKVPVVSADGTSVEVRTVCDVHYSFDERIEDGLYCATSLELIKRLVEDPETSLAGGS